MVVQGAEDALSKFIETGLVTRVVSGNKLPAFRQLQRSGAVVDAARGMGFSPQRGESRQAGTGAVAGANLPLLPNERAAVVLESEHSTDGELIGPEEVARLDKLIGEGARELAANQVPGAEQYVETQQRIGH